MLGSRYLNPYFGSGIYTWASLISTVLAALCVGYFIGGLARRPLSLAAVLGATVLIGSAYILVLPVFSRAPDGVRARGLRRREDRQPRRRLRDPVLSGHVPRHVFAVRHPAAAALGAAARAGSPARSTASPPPAASSARSAPLSSSFPRSARARSRLTLGVAGIAVRPVADRAAPDAAQRLRSHLRVRMLAGLSAPCACRRPDRRENPRRPAQACRRPRRPHRDRVQRHLHHQAAQPAHHVVPAQGLRLHRVGRQRWTIRTTCRCATPR